MRGRIKSKNTLLFVIKNGNKILIEFTENNKYKLPSIKEDNFPPSIPKIEYKIKEKYGLEVTGLKECFSYESGMCYEASIPHKVEEHYLSTRKWITIKTAVKYQFTNVDNLLLREFFNSFQLTEVQLQYGLRDGKIVHISELSDTDRGLACFCTCPACGVDLQARLGQGKRRPHFSHHNEACNIATAQETALHLLAKEILLENNHIWLPAYVLSAKEEDCVNDNLFDYRAINEQLRDYEYSPPYDFQFDNVILEKRVSDIIPDILIWRGDNGRKLIIEIAVTHFVDEVKKKKIEDHGISALEIDLSQLYNQELDRNILKEIIINSLDSKKWVHNIHYEKALGKLTERNKDIVDIAKKKEAEEKVKSDIFLQEQQKKAQRREVREQTALKNVTDALKVDNYKAIVTDLRDDNLALQYFRKMRFYSAAQQELPFFLDIPVTGQIAFNCDRRVWQMALFERFFYYRKESSYVSLLRIWKWFTKYEGKKFLNWDFVVKHPWKIGSKQYQSNLALEAIKQYLTYLGLLGYIEYFGDYRYREDYNIIPKTIEPPSFSRADTLRLVLDSIEDDLPTVDSNIEKAYNSFFSRTF